jgi:hypothetical protein
VWRRRIPLATALGPLNLSVFAGLMFVATAIARSAQTTIAGRYLDYVMLPGVISLTCCFILVRRTPRIPRWIAAWCVLMAIGYTATVGMTLLQMRARKPDMVLALLREYYATNDPRVLLENERYRFLIVTEHLTEFMAMLNRPGMREVLPLAVVSPETPPPLAARLSRIVGRFGLGLAALAIASAAWIAMRAPRPRRRLSVQPVLNAPAGA